MWRYNSSFCLHEITVHSCTRRGKTFMRHIINKTWNQITGPFVHRVKRVTQSHVWSTLRSILPCFCIFSFFYQRTRSLSGLLICQCLRCSGYPPMLILSPQCFNTLGDFYDQVDASCSIDNSLPIASSRVAGLVDSARFVARLSAVYAPLSIVSCQLRRYVVWNHERQLTGCSYPTNDKSPNSCVTEYVSLQQLKRE